MSVVEPSWIAHEPLPANSQLEIGDEELRIIQEELKQILASHHFHSSKRCQAFLRYAIEETLSGRRDLKERSIGIEVFDRSPSYDTNQDPVVRMTAGEVRKRLALYYQDSTHNSLVHLELPVGSYVPRFTYGLAAAVPPQSTIEAPPRTPTLSHSGELPAHSRDIFSGAGLSFKLPRSAQRFAVVFVVLSALLAFAGWRMQLRSPDRTPLHLFWQPLLDDPNPIYLSIGQIRPTTAEVEPNSSRSPLKNTMALQGSQGYPREIAVTVLSDAIAMTEMTSLLRAAGKQVSLNAESNTSLNDLQRGPVVLVGAFDNDWSIRFTDPLRFHFSVDEKDGSQWIADRQHPDAKIGLVNPMGAIGALKSDYAIVARFYDQRTRQFVVIVAGLTPYGTRAAGDFLMDSASLGELSHRGPAHWEKRNMEVLIRTDLIDNQAGPPVLIDTDFW